MMRTQCWLSVERAAGGFLVLGCIADFAGVTMFTARGGASGGIPPSTVYYIWELLDHDIYYPVLHHFASLLIGPALLWGAQHARSPVRAAQRHFDDLEGQNA